jgi:hypothetical protein
MDEALKIKKLIVELYFKKNKFDSYDDLDVKLEKKERWLFRFIPVPRKWKYDYTLILSLGQQMHQTKIAYNEKDAIKHLIGLIYKNKV